MPRILAITIGDNCAASTRVRVSSALGELELRGWIARSIRAGALSRWLKAVAIVIWWRPDVVVVQKLRPPVLISWAVSKLVRYLIYEIDDAIYMGYPGMGEDAAKAESRTFAIARYANRITTSNERIRADLPYECREKTVVFPGPAPPQSRSSSICRERMGAVWLGSPSTFINVSGIVCRAAEQVSGLRLVLVGAPFERDDSNITHLIWSEASQESELARARVGLAPLKPTDWNLRKASYKVLEYLAAGVVPVLEDNDANRLLLGENLSTLAVCVAEDSIAGWCSAIRSALAKDTDMQWNSARQAVLARLGAENYSRIFEPNLPNPRNGSTS